MVGKPEVLALIPARGGSKGIPRKNICDFAGAPLIAYSIAAGLQSRHVTRVIVSTDDEEIAAVAREWGAEVPFFDLQNSPGTILLICQFFNRLSPGWLNTRTITRISWCNYVQPRPCDLLA